MLDSMFRNMTPVVKNILILNVLMFLAQKMFPDQTIFLALFPIDSPYFKPWQLATHFFMHGSLGHIFFNMFAVVIFGVTLERVWGSKKFLFYYLATALGAAALHLLIAYLRHEHGITIGASGAVFGILVAFGYLFPNTELMLLFPPIPIKAKYFVLGYAAIELLLGIQNSPTDHIAHFAHLGGALTGIIIVLIWQRNKNTFY